MNWFYFPEAFDPKTLPVKVMGLVDSGNARPVVNYWRQKTRPGKGRFAEAVI
jgi:hypothetical protein